MGKTATERSIPASKRRKKVFARNELKRRLRRTERTRVVITAPGKDGE